MRSALEDLRVGDLILVVWLDASREVSRLPTDREVETRIQSWGVYLGIRGTKHKHLLLGQSKPPMYRYWEADRIPVPLIEDVIVVVPDFLSRYMPHATLQTKKITLTSARKAWKLVRVEVRPA